MSVNLTAPSDSFYNNLKNEANNPEYFSSMADTASKTAGLAKGYVSNSVDFPRTSRTFYLAQGVKENSHVFRNVSLSRALSGMSMNRRPNPMDENL